MEWKRFLTVMSLSCARSVLSRFAHVSVSTVAVTSTSIKCLNHVRLKEHRASPGPLYGLHGTSVTELFLASLCEDSSI